MAAEQTFNGKEIKLPSNEPWSALSHLIGAVLAVLGLVLLVVRSRQTASSLHTISFIIYGVSQVLLYVMSTLYHSFKRGTGVKQLFRRFDHISIFWFIAGTYTPVSLVALSAPLSWIMVGTIWGIALLGTLFKAVWVKSPGWINATLYIAMGWIALYVLGPLYAGVGLHGVLLMVVGGLLYSVGAVIYALGKRRDPKTAMLVHDVFHWFVLAGSVSFFLVMYFVILPLPNVV